MLREDELLTVFSYTELAKISDGDLDIGNNIKMVNKFFCATYKKFRNQMCSNLCEKKYGFKPPKIEEAPLLVKICNFIERNGNVSVETDSEDILKVKHALIVSAKKELEKRLPADWAYYYLAKLYIVYLQCKEENEKNLKPRKEKIFQEDKRKLEATIASYCYTAAQRFAPAQLLLAFFYQKGAYGLEKNQGLMYKYLNKSVEAGNTSAMVKLGNLLLSENKNEGLKYLEAAAKLEDKDALYDLALIYRDAKYGEKADAKKSIEYFAKAIELKSTKAALELYSSYVKGRGCILADSNEARKYLIKYHEIRISNNVKAAVTELGLLYLKNNEFPKACEYLKKAADAGDGFAALELARAYRKNDDPLNAVQFYIRAELLLKDAEKAPGITYHSLLEVGFWLKKIAHIDLSNKYQKLAKKYEVEVESSYDPAQLLVAFP